MTQTLAGQLMSAAEECPDRPWVTFIDGDSYTYGEFAQVVRRAAAGLEDMGVAPGERVVLFTDNCVELLIAWFAAHLAGCIAVPLNTALKGDGLDQVLSEVEPRLVIAEVRYLNHLRPHLERLGRAPAVVVVGDRGEFGRPFAALLGGAANGSRDRDASARKDYPGLSGGEDGTPCCIMYTSGTTGPSKGALYCNGYHLKMGEVGSVNMQYVPDDVLYTCLPLFHGNALNTSITPALLARASLAIGTRFSASRFWTEVGASGATALNLLGAMTTILLRREPDPAERAHSVTRALVIPAPADYHELLPERFGIIPIEAYGLSDGGMVLWCPPDRLAPPGSCGSPTDGYDVQLVDENDQLVVGPAIGQLVFRPAQAWTMSLGYWRRPDATTEAWRNLWFHTGDVLRRDERGWFYFVERAKDVIRRRGENISAFEVETATRSMPGVVDCAAYALPSDLSEDEVAIALVVDDGWSASEADVIDHLFERLPYFAVPRYVRLVDELPITETQKVRKHVLRDEGASVAWDREAAGIVISRSG